MLPAKTNDNVTSLSKLLMEQQPIPFLQLITFNSTVLANKSDLSPGNFYISRGEIDLGTEFKAVPVDVRSYAYVRKGGQILYDTFDPNSEEFKQAIMLSKLKKKGYQSKWGGMVLLYLIDQKIFVTYFLAGRGGGLQCLQDQVTPNLGKTVFFQSRKRKNRNNNIWFSPTVLVQADAPPPVLPESTSEVVEAFNARQGVKAEEEDER